MDTQNVYNPMLALLNYPAFFVKDGIIVQVNDAAKRRRINVDAPIETYLSSSLESYRSFREGCLYLELKLPAGCCSATVTLMEGLHLFCLEESSPAEKALALAAQQLRGPVHSLFSELDERPKEHSMRRSVYQIHRVLTNMADFPRYQDPDNMQLADVELNSFFAEILEKAAVMAEKVQIPLCYTALPQVIYASVDPVMLERAVYNLISNALKFSPAGETVDARLTVNDGFLHFSIWNQGKRIDPKVLQFAFARYQRLPIIENGLYGLGLGLSVVKTVAVNHGGTVLLDYPEEGGNRVTMTIRITSGSSGCLRSPIQLPTVDYAGGKDHALLEFSEFLPTKLY